LPLGYNIIGFQPIK